MTARALVWSVAGFVLWAAAFVLLYAGLSVGCAFGVPPAPLRIGLLALVAATLAGNAALALHVRGRQSGLLGRAGYLSALSALAASLLSFLPVAGLSLCG